MNSCLFILYAAYFFPTRRTSVGAAAPDAVLDIAGDQLRAGVDYSILPAIRGRGGGLTLGAPINATALCPLQVVQARQEVSLGLPLTFSPVNDKKGVVRVSTDLNIKFSAATTCVQPTVWRLSSYDKPTGQWFVSSGGVAGSPGRETIANWFKIDKDDAGKDYKLVFCPTVCSYCKVICSDVGVYIDAQGTRRLALTHHPFKIMFKKA